MDRRYTILAIVLIIAAFGLLIVPDRGGQQEITPEKLLLAINDPARFLSTDNITERIIGGDPTLQLIDVRPTEQFRKFALPGAVNIPVDSILQPKWKELLHQPGKNNVFYSNGDIEADRAWQMCMRTSVPRIFVMKGGLNYWYATIIKETKPTVTASNKDLDLYSFRQSAHQYFTGGSMADVKQAAQGTEGKEPAKVTTKRKAPEKPSGGGC